MNRRSLLLGLGAALAAPAIVKAESLMKIAALREDIVVEEIKYDLYFDQGIYGGPIVSGGPGGVVSLVQMRDLLLPGLRRMMAENLDNSPFSFR